GGKGHAAEPGRGMGPALRHRAAGRHRSEQPHRFAPHRRRADHLCGQGRRATRQPRRLAVALLQPRGAVLRPAMMIRTLLIALAASLGLAAAPASAERVRDLGAFQSVRSNQLTGYGIVVGLDGSGDDNFAYLTQAMRGVSDRFGLQLPPGVNPALKNAAAVI